MQKLREERKRQDIERRRKKDEERRRRRELDRKKRLEAEKLKKKKEDRSSLVFRVFSQLVTHSSPFRTVRIRQGCPKCGLWAHLIWPAARGGGGRFQ